MTAGTASDWTIMVYVSADHIAANFAVESLKQLRRAAGAGVVVVAQFDAAGRRDISQLLFTGGTDIGSTLEANRVGTLSRSLDMTAPETLTQFVDWAADQQTANHYCLFLWGHGCQLFLDEGRTRDEDDSAAKSTRTYLSPANLRKALEETQMAREGRKLDIIGFDACSMSLVEVASELQSCADFMIASQEGVPYTSFPYEQFLQCLKNHPDDVDSVCALISQLYKQAYDDYLAPPGMGEITLSSLRLNRIDTIAEPLSRLTGLLLSSVSDKDLRTAIIEARRAARDFPPGLFVDLFDFCHQLGSSDMTDCELRSACKDICDAIGVRGESACIIDNQAGEKSRCHGLSIYFPYLKDEAEYEELHRANVESPTESVEVARALKSRSNKR
jgi:hypothetical protein